MTSSEAFVETMVAHGTDHMFGIVGSAFMDALDIFPGAGIRFVSVQHEQNAVHMADGFSRVTNRPGVCIAQNGPGITNFVTGVAAAYWAHSPVVVITPETGSLTNGLGGFQETNQVQLLSKRFCKAFVSCHGAGHEQFRTKQLFCHNDSRKLLKAWCMLCTSNYYSYTKMG